MSIIEQNKKIILDLCRRYHVRQLYAFGSVLTDKFSTNSDIDMIVDFDSVNLENYADNYYDLKFSLEDLFKRKIDLLEEQAIVNPYFRKNVERQKQLIYG
jgi:predicted nucleotidyltransferase